MMGSSIFYTGGDGAFDLQVRIIDAPEHVLLVKEYKNVLVTSPCITLHFPTGQLAVDDGIIIKGIAPSFETTIPPGNYKCQAYACKFRGHVQRYYIVLARTVEPAINHEYEIINFSI